MINLYGPLQKLQVLLDQAATTTELPITAAFEQHGSGPAEAGLRTLHGITTGATAVDILPVPGTSKSRKVIAMSVYNADSASRVVTVRLSDSTTGTEVTRILFKVTLLTLEALYYSEHTGWYAVDANGFSKSNAPGSATATSTADSKAVLASSQVSSVQLSVSNTSSQASSIAAGIVVASINSVSSQASSMAALNPNTVSSLQSGASVQSFTSTTWSTTSSQASSMVAIVPATVSSQASSVAALNPNTVSSLQSAASVQSFTSTAWSTASSGVSRLKSSFGW